MKHSRILGAYDQSYVLVTLEHCFVTLLFFKTLNLLSTEDIFSISSKCKVMQYNYSVKFCIGL